MSPAVVLICSQHVGNVYGARGAEYMGMKSVWGGGKSRKVVLLGGALPIYMFRHLL